MRNWVENSVLKYGLNSPFYNRPFYNSSLYNNLCVLLKGYNKQERNISFEKKIQKISEKFRAGPGFSTQPGNPGSGFENFPGRVPGFEIFCPGSGPGSGFHFKIFRVTGPGTRPAPIPVSDRFGDLKYRNMPFRILFCPFRSSYSEIPSRKGSFAPFILIR